MRSIEGRILRGLGGGKRKPPVKGDKTGGEASIVIKAPAQGGEAGDENRLTIRRQRSAEVPRCGGREAAGIF